MRMGIGLLQKCKKCVAAMVRKLMNGHDEVHLTFILHKHKASSKPLFGCLGTLNNSFKFFCVLQHILDHFQ